MRPRLCAKIHVALGAGRRSRVYQFPSTRLIERTEIRTGNIKSKNASDLCFVFFGHLHNSLGASGTGEVGKGTPPTDPQGHKVDCNAHGSNPDALKKYTEDTRLTEEGRSRVLRIRCRATGTRCWHGEMSDVRPFTSGGEKSS